MWTSWDASAFRHQVEEVERLLPPGAQPTYVLSSHDAPRHRGRFDDPKWGEARARIAALMLLTLRGTPFLYYGEEIGMQNGFIPADRVCDPVGKRFPPLNRDPERTPMQWSAGPRAGFSSNPDPWLPIAEDPGQLNVAAQNDDPSSLLSFYRRVIWYRRANRCLMEGTYRSVEGPGGTFVYERRHGDDTIIVALNFEDRPISVSLPFGNGRLELSTDVHRAPSSLPANRIDLSPVEGVVIQSGR
jgi:alpha-glucosidase